MSSYKSHLPAEYNPGFVVGQGMNEIELQANDQLNQYFVQDLNRDPKLPFEDNNFDTVLTTVSVQYLRRPVEVFKEVGRVLKPGGLYIVSFSNRMFPTKAVALWRSLGEPERIELVRQYLKKAARSSRPKSLPMLTVAITAAASSRLSTMPKTRCISCTALKVGMRAHLTARGQ